MSHRIAFFCSDRLYPFEQQGVTSEVLRGIAGETRRLGCTIDIFDRRLSPSDFLKRGLGESFSGLIALPPFADEASRRAWRQLEAIKPSLNLLEFGELPNGNVVKVDDGEAVKQLVEHLVTLGHKDFGFAWNLKTSFVHRRREAFRQALEAGGIAHTLDNDIYLPTREFLNLKKLSVSAARRILKHYLPKGLGANALTAVVCSNDLVAHLLALVAKLCGVDVPRQLAIVGFDNHPYPFSALALDSRAAPIGITTVDLGSFQCGRLGIEVLCEIIDKRRPPLGQRIKLPPHLVFRESTVPAEKSENNSTLHNFKQSVEEKFYRGALSPNEVRQWAAQLGLSQAYFLIRFKKAFGRTFSEVLNERRVERAAGALSYTSRPVTEILQEVGYQSHDHFNRFFKRIKGCTPGAWRKRYKK